MKFPTIEEMAEAVGEEALDNFVYEGQSIREWVGLIMTGEYEPVIHAHWDFIERVDYWIGDADKWREVGGLCKTKKDMPVCSNCKTEFGRIVLKYKRCPECGAKMGEEVE